MSDDNAPKYIRKKKRITPIAIYLGDTPLREQRTAALDGLAAELGIENRSVLIQQIADGWIELRPRKRRKAVPGEPA